MKHDEQILWQNSTFTEYGTANKIEGPNTQPVLWCISAWTKGAVDVIPWQTIGNKESWMIAQQTSLFYPHPKGPMPSIRLKAFTRGQQDVEYLALLSHISLKPRFAVVSWLHNLLKLKENHTKRSQ